MAHRARTAAIGVAGALALGVTYGWYVFFGPGRFAERDMVQARLAAIPGVTVTGAYGHDDIGYGIAGFDVVVEGRGKIAFGALDKGSFERVERLHVYGVGEAQVLYTRYGDLGVYDAKTGEPRPSTGYGVGFTVGASGEFSSLFPFPLENVHDVINRYGEIVAEVARWPVQPEYATLEAKDGTRIYYAVKDPVLGEDFLYPSELESISSR